MATFINLPLRTKIIHWLRTHTTTVKMAIAGFLGLALGLGMVTGLASGSLLWAICGGIAAGSGLAYAVYRGQQTIWAIAWIVGSGSVGTMAAGVAGADLAYLGCNLGIIFGMVFAIAIWNKVDDLATSSDPASRPLGQKFSISRTMRRLPGRLAYAAALQTIVCMSVGWITGALVGLVLGISDGWGVRFSAYDKANWGSAIGLMLGPTVGILWGAMTSLRPRCSIKIQAMAGTIVTVLAIAACRFNEQADTKAYRELFALRPSTHAVTQTITWLPAGQKLLAGDWTGIRLWDLPVGTVQTFADGDALNSATALATDGGMVAWANASDHSIKLWDMAAGQLIATCRGHSKQVKTLAFSPNSRILASAGDDLTIKLWETVGGTELRSLVGHTKAINCIVFSVNSRQLASGGFDEKILLWEVSTGQEIRRLDGHRPAVACLAFSPQGHLLASSGFDNAVRLWDFSNCRVVHAWDDHRCKVLGLAFSADGTILASGDEQGQVRLWNPAIGEPIATLAGHGDSHLLTILHHRHREAVRAIAFTYDSKFMATGSDDATIKIWRVAK